MSDGFEAALEALKNRDNEPFHGS